MIDQLTIQRIQDTAQIVEVVSDFVTLSFCLLLLALGAVTLMKKKRTIPLLTYPPRKHF